MSLMDGETRVDGRLFPASALLLLGLLAAQGNAGAADAPPSVSIAPATDKTIGLVVTDVHYALYETPNGKEECPAGLQAGEVEQFKAQQDWQAHLQKYGGSFENRGPNGEKGNLSPMSVQDPIPWRDLQTSHGFGVNLDGTADGHATDRTRQHEKFTNEAGEPVDNQMARVVGCILGFRNSGLSITFYRNEVVTKATNRMLIEISGVDDVNNDPAVEVTLYKGRDQLVRTAAGDGFIPYSSQRIDARFPQYTYKTHGRIVKGALITDPIPAIRLPVSFVANVGERRFRDFTLHLKLKGDGAAGLMAGYENVSTWWNLQSKSVTPELDHYSPAGMYRALHRYADGYPDAKTGEYTGISVAYELSATRALIVHPEGPKSLVAAASGGRP
jgi:hypothetical protein